MTYQFKIQIKNIEPPVWRRLLVPNDITFDMFHEVIQAAFGWENCHLYQFSPKGWRSTPLIQPPSDELDHAKAGDSETTELLEIFTRPKQTFTYIYDFGDDWLHQIKLEKITDQLLTSPLCTDGQGACPPEDCGGYPGYINLLETLANPKHPEYKEMRQWLGLTKGKDWDVNAFDIEEVNTVLRSMIE